MKSNDSHGAEDLLPLVYEELRKLAAAESMRRILIENARRKLRVRHGGELDKVSASATGFDVAAPQLNDAELLRLNDALDASRRMTPARPSW